jgi:hypothetical protein
MVASSPRADIAVLCPCQRSTRHVKRSDCAAKVRIRTCYGNNVTTKHALERTPMKKSRRQASSYT